MSKGFKKKEFKLTPKVIIRILLFSLIVYLIISYLSQTTTQNAKFPSSVILGETTKIKLSPPPQLKAVYDNIYNLLPENSRHQLNNLNESPVTIFIQEKMEIVKQETIDFPQKQIKEIKKSIIHKMYLNLMNSIENN